MPFIMNAWYICAWPDEIKQDEILARTICGQALIFFRGGTGEIAALEDRCCHREMPLSMGWMEGETVQCGYHGLRFDRTGKCVEIPGQPNIPPRAKVESFPVVEKYGAVWLWPGDPEAADPELIPEMFAPMDHPDWSFSGGTTYVACNYQLISDNLLDLTHENYIHRSSLGNESIIEHPITTKSDEDRVTVQRLIPEHDPAPFWKQALKQGKGLEDVLCDRWQVIHFQPPANLVLEVGVAPAGTGGLDGDRRQGVEGRNTNAITPETETSSHYFWGFARNFNRDPELDPVFSQKVAEIFEEDKIAVEAVQKVMEANTGREVIDINADAGHILARKMVREKVVAEQG